MGPKSLTTVSSLFIYLALGLTRSFTSKNAWALCHEFKQVPFSSCSCVIGNEWRQLHSVLFISVEYFYHKKWILSWSALWNSQIKIIKFSVVLKIWDEWYNKWIITQEAGTPCFFRMLTVIFKNEFHVKMSSNQFDLHFTLLEMSWPFNFYFLTETDDRNWLLCSLLLREMWCDPTIFSWYYWPAKLVFKRM